MEMHASKCGTLCRLLSFEHPIERERANALILGVYPIEVAPELHSLHLANCGRNVGVFPFAPEGGLIRSIVCVDTDLGTLRVEDGTCDLLSILRSVPSGTLPGCVGRLPNGTIIFEMDFGESVRTNGFDYSCQIASLIFQEALPYAGNLPEICISTRII